MNLGDPVGAEADLMNLQDRAAKFPYYLKMENCGWRKAHGGCGRCSAIFFARDPIRSAIRGIVQVDEAKQKPADAGFRCRHRLSETPTAPGCSCCLQLQVQAKELKQAEDSVNRVLALDKNNVAAMVLLAQLVSADGSTDKAIALYQRAIEVSPRDVRLQIALGGLYERAGNWQQAEST
jgi:tetratricopeptide (TPR) repeat protein